MKILLQIGIEAVYSKILLQIDLDLILDEIGTVNKGG